MSNYEKLMARIEEVSREQITLIDAVESLLDYIEGIPWRHITAKERLLEKAIIPALEKAKEYWLQEIESRAKRVKPAYRRVWEWLLEPMDKGIEGLAEVLLRLRAIQVHKYAYIRRIAAELGLAFTTVRDAITWAAREVLFGRG